MKHFLAACLLTSLVACAAILGSGPHVPNEYQGTIQITVENAWGKDICVVTIFAGDANNADNWLGTKSKKVNLPPGAARVFSIKPGRYHVVGGFCDN